MKILTIVFVSALAGLALGYASTVAEFGVTPPLPRLEAAGGGRVAAGAPAKLVIDSAVHEFGVMPQSSQGSHTFVLKNEGRGTLLINPGKPSCKCTISRITSERILPGQTAEITVDWKTGRSGPNFNQNVPLHTNDPDQSWVRLVIRGTVTPEFSFDPAVAYIRGLTPYQSATHEAMLHFYTAEDVEIENFRLANLDSKSFYNLQIEPVPLDQVEDKNVKSAFRITTKIAEGLPVGPLQQSITLTPSIKMREAVRMLYTGQVHTEVGLVGRSWDYREETLNLGDIKQADGKEHIISLHVMGKHRVGFGMSVAEVVPEFLQVHPGESIPWRDDTVTKIPLKIVVPPGAEACEFPGPSKESLGKIVLKTSHPHYPEVPIFVKMTVAP